MKIDVSSYTQSQKIRILVHSMFESTAHILPECYYALTERVLLRRYISYSPLPSPSLFRNLVYRWSANAELSNLAIQEYADILKDAKAIYDENNYSL